MSLFPTTFFLSSVLGPVRDHILHLTTGRGTTNESTRTGIFEGTTEDIGDLITSVAGIEVFTHGASITEVAMGITGPTGKTTAKLIALGGAVPVRGRLRGGLHPRDREVILEILTSRPPIDRGGLRPLGPPPTTAEPGLLSAGH